MGKRNFALQNNSLIFGKYVLHTSAGEDSWNKDSYDKLYVFDKDGKLLWSFRGEWNMKGFAVTPDFIAVGDDEGYLYALSWDGKLLWKFKVGDLISNVSAGDINSDGEVEVVVGSVDDHIYALSGKDGRLLWKFKTEDDVDSSPALGDINGDSEVEVVVGSKDDHIYAFSGKDGRLLWKSKTEYYVWSSPALGDLDGDGYIDMAVASWDGYLYVFEATARGGEVVWSTFHGDASRTGLYQNAVSFAKANLSGNAFAWYPTGVIGVASEPPYLEITSVKLYDEDMDRLFEAGEKGKLVVKIANTGKGTAYGMKLKVYSPFFNKTIYISKLQPNEETTKEITFTVPIRVKTQKVYAHVELDAGKYSPEPVKVAFTTKAPIPPKFKIVYKVDDDRVGESIGNSNGIVEPRETIELLITVKNTGKGEAKDVKVKLVSRDVDIIKGQAKIGNLPPGASASAKLVFFVPANLKKEKIDFSLKIEEALGIFTTSTKLALNVKKRGGRVYDYAVAYREEEYSHSSPSVEVEAVEPVISQTARNCVRPNPNYYIFGVVVYDYDEITDLDYVKNDKKLIYKLATCYMGVPEENTKILENPAYAKLKRELRKFASSIKKKDATLYFYYSGHGILDSKGKFYILPVDASIEDEVALKESGVDIDELKGLLARARGKKVALIDACRIDPPWKPAVVVYKPKLTDQAFIFSTKEGQLSNIDKDKKYSAFTRALYEMASSGLVNLDFDDDGYVEIKELIRPLTNWVRKVSADAKQTPDVWGPKDFEIFPVE